MKEANINEYYIIIITKINILNLNTHYINISNDYINHYIIQH